MIFFVCLLIWLSAQDILKLNTNGNIHSFYPRGGMHIHWEATVNVMMKSYHNSTSVN
jgi:hypothetical protein